MTCRTPRCCTPRSIAKHDAVGAVLAGRCSPPRFLRRDGGYLSLFALLIGSPGPHLCCLHLGCCIYIRPLEIHVVQYFFRITHNITVLASDTPKMRIIQTTRLAARHIPPPPPCMALNFSAFTKTVVIM